jgi:hypothetical protein
MPTHGPLVRNPRPPRQVSADSKLHRPPSQQTRRSNRQERGLANKEAMRPSPIAPPVQISSDRDH